MYASRIHRPFARMSGAATLLAVVLFAAGCASAPPTGGMKEPTAVETGPGPGYGLVRKAAGFSQGALLYTNSVYVNPLLRPFSHVSSLTSLVVKSTGGAMRRVVISAAQMPSLRGDVPETGDARPMDLDAFELDLDRITGTRQSLGTIDFLVDGDEYFLRLEEAIDTAAESIDIRTYIFDNDDYAVEFAARLRERSRFVDVRVLVDSLANMQALLVDPDSMPLDHRPPLSMNAHIEAGSAVRVRQPPNPWLTGDHTKTTIIDRELAFVGGMNIGREYRYDWHDLMMEVRGPVVTQLQHDTDVAWVRAGLLGDIGGFFQRLKRKRYDGDMTGYPLRILKTGDFDSDIYKAQIAAIQRAQSYILIENAYFSDDRTLYELARARRRGVDVRVILPESGNHAVLDHSNNVAINQMLRHGIRVYRYPGMSHVKAAIFDGWVCVGSANFDKMSLQINKELNLATSEPAVARELLEAVFLPDLMVSEEINDPIRLTMAARIAEIIVDELL